MNQKFSKIIFEKGPIPELEFIYVLDRAGNAGNFKKNNLFNQSDVDVTTATMSITAKIIYPPYIAAV